MGLRRRLGYFLRSLFINMFRPNVRVALSSKIERGTFLGRHVRVGAKTHIEGEIGDYSYVGSGCRLHAKIGKFCSIAPNVRVVNATHPIRWISTSPVFFSTKKQCGYTLVSRDEFDEVLYADSEKRFGCVIGNDVLIGENVMIKWGVRIGDGAIIPTFRTLEPHGKIVSAQQGFVRISRTVLYPNIGGRISAGLSQTPRRS